MKLSSHIFIICFACIALLNAAATAQSESPQGSVRLITIGPGDEAWEKFGHNMIEIHANPGYGRDVSMNWGLFDFDQPNFIARFVQGRMLYTMRALPSEAVLDEYRLNNRRITIQQIKLSPEQIARLIGLCELNRLPENRDYRYDYFQDNCSTRVRDMLNRATDGELKRVIDAQPRSALSYRQHSMRLLQDDFWLSLGMDFALGPFCDRPLSAWDAAFLPGELSDSISPLATTLPPPWASTRPVEPTEVPNRTLPMLFFGLLAGAVMVGLSFASNKWVKRFVTGLAIAWWSLTTIGGLFMLYMWFLTDHVAAYANQNLLQFTPLGLVVMMLWWRGKRKQFASDSINCLFRLVLISVVAMSLLGLVGRITGILSQQNMHFIVLTLPLNLAAGLTVMRSAGLLRRS